MIVTLGRLNNLSGDINSGLKQQEESFVEDEMGGAQDNMDMLIRKLEKLYRLIREVYVALLFYS